MKKLIILIGLFSFQAFSANVEDTINNIERNEQVRCQKTSESIRFCLFMSCRHTERYTCVGSTKTLYARLTVRTIRSFDEDGPVTIENVSNIDIN